MRNHELDMIAVERDILGIGRAESHTVGIRSLLKHEIFLSVGRPSRGRPDSGVVG